MVMTFKEIVGVSLALLVLFSTFMGVLGVWEVIPADVPWKTIEASVVIGIGVGATSLVVDSFMGTKK